LPVGQPLF
jgi:hypothetical protein